MEGQNSQVQDNAQGHQRLPSHEKSDEEEGERGLRADIGGRHNGIPNRQRPIFLFVLDGVLIGAGDHRYLAIASCIQLAVYVPFLAVAALVPLPGLVLAWIWVAFGIYMVARWVTLEVRQRSGAWLVE